MLALGKRGLVLRGTCDKYKRVEDGNFNFFIKWKSKFDAVLKTHLDTAPRNATYLSPQIQNELIASIEDEIREGNLVKDFKIRFSQHNGRRNYERCGQRRAFYLHKICDQR